MATEQAPQKRYSTEYAVKAEGNLENVLGALFRKKRRLDEGKCDVASDIRFGLTLGPGGLQGFTHAVFLSLLKEYGLLEHVDVIVGVSTGAAAAVVGVGLAEGDIVGEDAYVAIAHNGEVRLRRGYLAINTTDIGDRLRRSVDPEKLKQSNTEIFAIMVDATTGEPIEEKVNNHPDPVAVAMASSSAPLAAEFPYTYTDSSGRSRQVIDGMFASPFASDVQAVREEMTHWLVLSPYPPGNPFPQWQIGLMALHPVLRQFPKAREIIRNVNAIQAASLHQIRMKLQEGKAALAYPEQMFDPFTNDWARLRATQANAKDAWRVVFENARMLSQV